MEEIIDNNDNDNDTSNTNDNNVIATDVNDDSAANNENMNRGLLSSNDNDNKEQYYNLIGSNNDGFNSSDDDDYNDDNDDDDSLTDHEPIDDDEFGEFGEYVQLNDVNEDIVGVVVDNAISSLTNDYLRTINQSNINYNNDNNNNVNSPIIEEEIPTIDEENYDSVDVTLTPEIKKVFPPSIPPLNAEKIDAIKTAMSKLKLTKRAGAECVFQNILKSNLRIGDEEALR